MTPRKTPDPRKLKPVMSGHTPMTRRQLKTEGLPLDTPLWVTSGGRVRHVTMNDGMGTPNKALCNLFRTGNSVMRRADRVEDDGLPVCGACLRTLEAEVMRAKEAMKRRPSVPKDKEKN